MSEKSVSKKSAGKKPAGKKSVKCGNKEANFLKKSNVRTLSQKAGVQRLRNIDEIHKICKEMTNQRIVDIMQIAKNNAEASKRKTIMDSDILNAIQIQTGLSLSYDANSKENVKRAKIGL